MQRDEWYERIRFRGQPMAHPKAVAVYGRARFTVLTPRLLRLEWSEEGIFEDRSTYAFPTRYTDSPPAFTTREEGGEFILETDALMVRYRPSAHPLGRFTGETLVIRLRSTGETWKPGQADPQNLRGTRRTLDGCDGDASLEEGLLSRAGWAVFDDSSHVVFDETGWVAPRPDFALQDWYFFGYGRDFKAALRDYTRFGGEVPLIPRFVLGAWWSRYWAYSDEDLRRLVAEFEAHDVPLDVLVIDMDWHTPHSWTGYTWNRELFPDPPAFLRWAHAKGLRVTLNLHPAEGVQPFEEIYPRFAQAMGVDPASRQPIPFRIADKRFVRHYFALLHHPMEDEGVDFWWMDWQQGESSEVKGLDPLPWLNHLHFQDSRRRGLRPMLYSRWGGLGNHRYYIGFSGDTYATWNSLRFQPFFTATAANVLYGWWSHDIGGHMGGATEPELYARWVQYGALSPVLRLHATKDPRAERRPWAYPEPVYRAAKAAFHWRYRLIPYLYTMARVAADTAISLCRPTYYEHPDDEAAYIARYQYYLGDQMIAAPIVFPADAETGLAHQDVWIPPGTWFAYDTLEQFEGPRWVRLLADLNRMPMLMRAGAILPLSPTFGPQSPPRLASGTTDALPKDHLELVVFPGEGTFRLYEDDGITEAYRRGAFEWTPLRTRQPDAHTWEVTVGPVEGRCDALPDRRRYTLRLRGCRRPARLLVDGEPVSAWRYDAQAMELVVEIPLRSKARGLTLTAVADGPIVGTGEAHNATVVAADLRRLLGEAAPQDVETLLASEAGAGWQDALARLGGPFVSAIPYVTPEEASRRLGHLVIGGPRDGTTYDLEATFFLHRGGRVTRRTVTLRDVTGDRLLPVPFAFDGQVQTTYWTVEVALTWRGRTWTWRYESQPFFPTLHTLQALIYDAEEVAWSPADMVDATGRLRADLPWEDFSQHAEDVYSLTARHLVRFYRSPLYGERVRAGEPLAAYLATTIISPDAREAVLVFLASEPTEIYVNGEPVVVQPQEEDADLFPLFREPRRTYPFALRAGENTLLIHTRNPGEGEWRWFFGGGLATPEGELMADVTLTRGG